MSDEPTTGYYDVEGVVSRPITVAEWDMLCAMFAGDGWAIWMDLKRGDLIAAISDMGVEDASEAVRAAYNLLMQDVTAEARLRTAISDTKPVPLEETQSADADLVDLEKSMLERLVDSACSAWMNRKSRR